MFRQLCCSLSPAKIASRFQLASPVWARAVLITSSLASAILPAASAQQVDAPAKSTTVPAQSKDDQEGKKQEKWIALLQSNELTGWEKTNFGGEGEVSLKEGVLRLERGDPLTGVHYKKKDFPKENFELRWKARRVDGSDFFAGVTFPIGDEHCSFICGGWGGGLVGISSINGNDASENATSGFRDFKNKQWYSFRIRVDKKLLQVWIDDEEIISVERADSKFSLRAEVLASRPLGYCAFQSITEVKDWEYKVIE